MKIDIGTKFKYYADKNKREYTVTDCHTTLNMAGDVVAKEWIAVSMTMGQPVPRGFSESAIVRSILKEG